METIANRNYREKAVATAPTWYKKFIAEATYNYFFVISFVILVGSCWGGITAMYILKANAPIWQLCLNIYITMANNIAPIGQASAKWVIGLFILSSLVNLILVLANAY